MGEVIESWFKNLKTEKIICLIMECFLLKEKNQMTRNGKNCTDNRGNNFRMFILDEAANQAEKEGNDIIRLTLGKVDIPLHQNITSKMKEVIDDIDRFNLVYPTGLPALKKELSEYYKKNTGLEISENNIIIDSGSSSIYRNIFSLICNKDEEVIIPSPYYPLYRVSAEMAGAYVAYYNIRHDSLKVDFDSLKEVVNSKTRAIVINTPGNPFGNIISSEDLIKIGKLLPKGSYIILDEIYENARFTNTEPLIRVLFDSEEFHHLNIIITNSFSKGYRMYARRVGWVLLPDHLIEKMTIVLHHTNLTVDPVAQFAAIEALRLPEEVKQINNDHYERWCYTKKSIREIEGLRLLESQGGFYCTIDCTKYKSKQEISNCFDLAYDILQKTGVAVVPGQDFGVPGMLRLSFTNKRYNEAIDRLKDYFLANKL